jgi:DNA polymerase/3'-5' exonuclease PolX
MMDNKMIAEWLRQHARNRDAEGGNLLRVRAYRRVAHLIDEMDAPLAAVYEQYGRRGLRELPGIGPRIAKTIEDVILASRAA